MGKGTVFFIFMLILHSLLTAENFFVPEQFRNGEPIDQIILISDVDGVIRDSTEAVADPRIICAIKSLLEDAVGKSFFDFKYILRCDSSGQWDYYSIREIQN